jgi:hypothetical protein
MGALEHADSKNKKWLGRQDSNLGMTVPKTVALPLGYAPTFAKTGELLSKKTIRCKRYNEKTRAEMCFYRI